MPFFVNTFALYCLLSLSALFNWKIFISGQYPTLASGPPRFKQNARTHQYAYLGDSVRFRCTAIGRPQPKVHWYRNGGYLNYSFMQTQPRFREKSMSLEIRHIEFGDKGNWMCRVWNSEGSTTRNFTLHIIDYCDYFLDVKIAASSVPDECGCEWATVTQPRDDRADHTHYYHSATGETLTERRHANVRTDIDLSAYDEERCVKLAEESFHTHQLRSDSVGRISSTTTTTTINSTIILPQSSSKFISEAGLKIRKKNNIQAKGSGSKESNSNNYFKKGSSPTRSSSITVKQTEIIGENSSNKKKQITENALANGKISQNEGIGGSLTDADEKDENIRPRNRIRFILERPYEPPTHQSHDQNAISTKPFSTNTTNAQTSFTDFDPNFLPVMKYIQRISATAKTTVKVRNPQTKEKSYMDLKDYKNLSLKDSNLEHNSKPKYPDAMPGELNSNVVHHDLRSNDSRPNLNLSDSYTHSEQHSRSRDLSITSNIISEKTNSYSHANPTNDLQNSVTFSEIHKPVIMPTNISPTQLSTFKSGIAVPKTNPARMFEHLSKTGVPDVAHLLPELITPTIMRVLREELKTHWNSNLDDEAKTELAARIVANLTSIDSTDRPYEIDRLRNDDAKDRNDTHHLSNDDVDDDEDEEDNEEHGIVSPTNELKDGLKEEKEVRNNTDWPNPPNKVAPYFRQMDSNVNKNIVLPAGRTLKLNCKAGGQPEPQVIWRKDNIEIQRDTESHTGSLFHLRKWSLELEDAAESDSGDYECEAFNVVGWVTRRFHVEVQDRLRSRPIIVPNVLLNQTIDVNNTVRFTCQVISDLVPHIIWIKLVRQNGSFIHIDPKRNQPSFNFIDMSTLKKAHIYHDERTNKYTLEIANVTMQDQGIYSCVAGNTLGMSMANATLTVNEFRPMTLPTEKPYSWPISYTILLALCAILLIAFLALSILYCSFSSENNKHHRRVQNYEKLAVRKKVIITKKPERSGDVWSDLTSSYAITVEPVLSNGSGLALDSSAGGGALHASSADETALLANRPTASSDVTMLSEYEVPTDVAWEIDRNQLQLIDILGEGAFGEVWKGVLCVPNRDRKKDGDSFYDNENAQETRLPVAVKKLKTNANEKELIILVSEMQILKSIGEHRNILRLIGCCTGIGPLLVVLEICPYGNLRDFLRKHRPREDQIYKDENDESDDGEFDNSAMFGALPKSDMSNEGIPDGGRRRREPRRVLMYQNMENLNAAIIKNLTLRDLVRFSTEIARGMEFLASKKIIHRDLAARNVLVAENYTMKISDFGLSRNVFYQDYYRKRGAGRLPIKWMAPEALEANVYTVYSDVWSYGILLWEIMTLGGTPYPSIAMPQLYNILKEGYRMEAPHNCPDEIYGVMVMCWQDKPDQRPQFQIIADYFDWMLTEAANYTAKSDNGETTDEGSYAIINETLKNRVGQTIAHSRRTRTRPLSAPGMMSFEAFATASNNKKTSEADNVRYDKEASAMQISSLSRSYEDAREHIAGVEDESTLLLGEFASSSSKQILRNSERKLSVEGTTPTRKKSSLIELIQSERAHSVEAARHSPKIIENMEQNNNGPFYTNTFEMQANNPASSQNTQLHSDSFFVDSAISSPLVLSPLDQSANANDEQTNFSTIEPQIINVAPSIFARTNNRLLSAIEEDINSNSGGDCGHEDEASSSGSESKGCGDQRASGDTARLTPKRSTHEYVNELIKLSPLFASHHSLGTTATNQKKQTRKSNSSSALSTSIISSATATITPSSSKSLNKTASFCSMRSISKTIETKTNRDKSLENHLKNHLVNEDDEPPNADNYAKSSEKRSVASEHALRINAVSGEPTPLFRTIDQQVKRKNGSTLSENSQPGSSGLGSSTVLRQIEGFSNRNESTHVDYRQVSDPQNVSDDVADSNNNHSKHGAKFANVTSLTRSFSSESQASSGRGGSSAMSSADALGAHLIMPLTHQRKEQLAAAIAANTSAAGIGNQLTRSTARNGVEYTMVHAPGQITSLDPTSKPARRAS